MRLTPEEVVSLRNVERSESEEYYKNLILRLLKKELIATYEPGRPVTFTCEYFTNARRKWFVEYLKCNGWVVTYRWWIGYTLYDNEALEKCSGEVSGNLL